MRLRNLFRSFDSDGAAPTQIGDVTVDAGTPAPDPTFDTNFSSGENADEVVWHGGAGYQKAADGTEGNAAPSQDDDPLADLFAGYEDVFGDAPNTGQQPQQAQRQPEQPTYAPQPQYGDMPEDFNAELLNEQSVSLQKQRIDLGFQAEAAKYQDNPAALQALNIARHLAARLVDFQSKYSSMTVLAKQMYDSNADLNRKVDVVDRVRAARILAERNNISDYRTLLKNPKTGEPIKSAAEMKLLASMMGEAKREQNIQARANVDRPMNPVQATNAGRSIDSIDPQSKAFEEIERAVASGKHVRLLA